MSKLIAKNPTAKHNYTIIDTLETGIVLSGTEIKSIRNGKVNLKDSYAAVSYTHLDRYYICTIINQFFYLRNYLLNCVKSTCYSNYNSFVLQFHKNLPHLFYIYIICFMWDDGYLYILSTSALISSGTKSWTLFPSFSCSRI